MIPAGRKKMMRERLAMLGIVCAISGAHAEDFKIDPKASYLRANGESPPPALIVPLADLGLAPGDWAYIEVLGDWDCGGPCGDDRTDMLFVFSSTDELLGPGELHRVPGAIDVCPDVVTPNTFNGNLPTDIPEDFQVGGVEPISITIQVPAEAAYIFCATRDSQYFDNSDPDNDLFARIEPTEQPCIADFNRDGNENILDFVAFQTGFQAMDCRADCDENGSWNILDFVCFQQAFVAGCG
jgi:hypothetical protein